MPSDADLTREALVGSQAASSALVRKYAPAAINFAARVVNDRNLAEELTQEAFVRVFSRLRTYDQDRPFSAWFFRVLHNVCVDHLRRRRAATVSFDTPLSRERASDEEAATEALSSVLEVLPSIEPSEHFIRRTVEAAWLARVRARQRMTVTAMVASVAILAGTIMAADRLGLLTAWFVRTVVTATTGLKVLLLMTVGRRRMVDGDGQVCKRGRQSGHAARQHRLAGRA